MAGIYLYIYIYIECYRDIYLIIKENFPGTGRYKRYRGDSDTGALSSASCNQRGTQRKIEILLWY